MSLYTVGVNFVSDEERGVVRTREKDAFYAGESYQPLGEC